MAYYYIERYTPPGIEGEKSHTLRWTFNFGWEYGAVKWLADNGYDSTGVKGVYRFPGDPSTYTIRETENRLYNV